MVTYIEHETIVSNTHIHSAKVQTSSADTHLCFKKLGVSDFFITNGGDLNFYQTSKYYKPYWKTELQNKMSLYNNLQKNAAFCKLF